jgi:NAD(P)-dependent dehydrogenase (short-subunit alcohol dehydrogenase family)
MKKIALVTGSNKGIGLEMARQLAKEDVLVILSARNEAKGKEATELLKSEGYETDFIQLDMDNEQSIKEAAATIEKKYGHLDILINNAGIILDNSFFENTTESISLENLKKTFNTNFFGLISLTQQLLPLIKKSAAGRIVNMSSILGSLTLHADPSSPVYGGKPLAYNASKTALNQFTVHLAHALKDTKIKVNSAHPGWVKTDMGGDNAMMDVVTGAQTGVSLALLDENGPTGQYIHLGEQLPW